MKLEYRQKPMVGKTRHIFVIGRLRLMFIFGPVGRYRTGMRGGLQRGSIGLPFAVATWILVNKQSG